MCISLEVAVGENRPGLHSDISSGSEVAVPRPQPCTRSCSLSVGDQQGQIRELLKGGGGVPDHRG